MVKLTVLEEMITLIEMGMYNNGNQLWIQNVKKRGHVWTSRYSAVLNVISRVFIFKRLHNLVKEVLGTITTSVTPCVKAGEEKKPATHRLDFQVHGKLLTLGFSWISWSHRIIIRWCLSLLVHFRSTVKDFVSNYVCGVIQGNTLETVHILHICKFNIYH
jgi:hypothetical protein